MFENLRSTLTQFFPPKPSFLEKDCPDLTGKVYIVTGSNTGVGKEVARMLYAKNAKVYLAARSEERTASAISDIEATAPDSAGLMEFLPLDLADLTTIKSTTERFLSKESKLHALFNNAGVQTPNPTKTVQGYETHLGINCVGTFLLTKLLTPTLVATAQSEPRGTIRVIWVSSSGTELAGIKSTGIDMNNLDYHIPKSFMDKYAFSKTGNWLHAVEFAKRYQSKGVVSVPLNPGNLRSDLFREHSGLFWYVLQKCLMYPPIYGAHTQLYGAFSPDLTIENSGSWVVPFGRILPIREDLLAATKTKDEGGNGTASKFWDWTEDQVKAFK